MKNAIKTRMMNSSCFSVMFFFTGLIRSIVNTELEVSTSEESVDIEAESTSTSTTANRNGESFSIIVGTMPSKPPTGAPFSSASANSLPKPPRK